MTPDAVGQAACTSQICNELGDELLTRCLSFVHVSHLSVTAQVSKMWTSCALLPSRWRKISYQSYVDAKSQDGDVCSGPHTWTIPLAIVPHLHHLDLCGLTRPDSALSRAQQAGQLTSLKLSTSTTDPITSGAVLALLRATTLTKLDLRGCNTVYLLGQVLLTTLYL